MGEASITYLPVGNGDCTLTRLKDDTTIVLDINLCADACDPAVKTRYDIKAHLKREAKKDADGRLYHDVFGLTHPDQDHCRGFDEVFFDADPRDYDAKKNAGEIIAHELWFSPRIFGKYEKQHELSQDARAFKKEANRRLKLHENGDMRRDDPGNRIRIIGYTKDPYFEKFKHLTTYPGQTLNVINGKVRDCFEAFIHAPFKEDTDSDEGDRNGTSIVFQARFKEGGDPRAGLAFFGGDSNMPVWDMIHDRSADEDLEWDIFMAPHHSSWTFFRQPGSPDETEASEKVLAILDKRRVGAWVISSSKTRKTGADAPPPQKKAVKEFEKKVGASKYLITQEHPNENEPQPIIVDVTLRGMKVRTRQESSVSVVVGRESPRLG